MSIIVMAIIGAIVSFFLGFVWHGPVFGKQWAIASGMGWPENGKPTPPKGMSYMMLIQFIANFMIAFVLYYFLSGFLMAPMGLVIIFGLLIWVGFILPTQIMGIMWNGRPVRDQLKMFGIAVGYQVINMVILALLFVAMR